MLSFTSVLNSCHPANCVDAILASSKSSTRMLKTNEKRKMKLAVRVSSATHSAPQVLCQSISLCKRFPSLVGKIEFPNLVAIAFAYQPMQSVLLGTLVFVLEVVPVNLRQHFVNKVDCDTYFFVHAALYVRYQFWQHDPSISPTRLNSQWQASAC